MKSNNSVFWGFRKSVWLISGLLKNDGKTSRNPPFHLSLLNYNLTPELLLQVKVDLLCFSSFLFFSFNFSCNSLLLLCPGGRVRGQGEKAGDRFGDFAERKPSY